MLVIFTLCVCWCVVYELVSDFYFVCMLLSLLRVYVVTNLIVVNFRVHVVIFTSCVCWCVVNKTTFLDF